MATTTVGLTPRFTLIGPVALAAVLMTVAPARADIIPAIGADNPIIKDLGAGNGPYDYATEPSNSQILTIGDFFMNYDFGAINAPLQIGSGARWTTTTSGRDGHDQSPPLNYPFTANSNASGANLGVFSTFAPISRLVPVASIGHGTDIATGQINSNLTNTQALFAGQFVTVAPEPASLTLLGLGLALGARTLRKWVKP